MNRWEVHDLDCLQDHPRYKKIRDLNQGTFGFVQLAWDKRCNPPQQVAVKFMERGDKVTKYVEAEILNHRMLLHPHIIQFREVFLTPKYLCIVMEYAPGGDMFEYVVRKNGLKEDEARWFFQQLIVAIDYCHRMGVANRDIKLENTLLDGSVRPLLKICDFGYSKSEIWQSIAKSKVGTPTYFAPEIIEEETYNPMNEKYQSAPGSRVGTPAYLAPEVILTTSGKKYDGKIADIWSCGVMLYVMLVGSYPFERPEDKHDDSKLQKMIQRILRVDYCFPSHIRVSNDLLDLLMRILVREPTRRITIEEIQNHRWYRKNLPPGVKEMNSNLVIPHEGLQTLNEIEGIVQQARTYPDARKNKFTDLDDYLEDALNEPDQPLHR